MPPLNLLFHTVRHLKPAQVYRRLWFRLHKPTLNLAPAPARRPAAGAWVAPACRRPSLVADGVFSFLNQTASLQAVGWDSPDVEKLWRYNQHYHDDLNAADSTQRRAWHQNLLSRWLADNPPGQGTGWEPYPLSLRLVNWVKFAQAGGTLPAQAQALLAVQARWLCGRLEWHLLGNHLFANAKALVFAGLYFQGAEAQGWLRQGLQIIGRELPEQLLPDGGNFERSPMYHGIFLEDLLDLVNAAACWAGTVDGPAQARWRQAAQQMAQWLVVMTHPDGEIAHFNDTAIGIAPSPAELLRYAARLGVAVSAPTPGQEPAPGALATHVQSLQPSGYVRLESPHAVALLDVAPIGPDYLPGHAHADTLSFELSVHGQRVLVNGGTSCYGISAERLRERETAAHNTVELDGLSSSEVWSGFRVARRAYPRGLHIQSAPGAPTTVRCSHDGYRRLPGKPVHTRQWIFAAGELTVRDTVSRPGHRAVARYLLHPQVQIEQQAQTQASIEAQAQAINASHWQLTLPGGETVNLQVSGARAQLVPARHAPEFGRVLPTWCLAVEFENGSAEVRLSWR